MDGLRLLENLHRSEQLGADIFAKLVEGTDITPRQAIVLRRISVDAGCSQTDIVDATGIDRSTLADVVRRMQRKGWVARRRKREDARTYAVKITPAGLAILAKLRSIDKALVSGLRGQVSGIDTLKIVGPVSAAAE